MPFLIFGAKSLRRTEGDFEKRSAKRQFHMTAFVLHLSFHTIFDPKPSNLTAAFSHIHNGWRKHLKSHRRASLDDCTALLWRLRVMNDFLKLQDHRQHPALCWLGASRRQHTSDSRGHHNAERIQIKARKGWWGCKPHKSRSRALPSLDALEGAGICSRFCQETLWETRQLSQKLTAAIKTP